MTIFRVLLFPIQCSDANDTISTWLRNTDAPCTPFAVPELAVTLPSLLLVLLFVIFSLVTTLLTFEVNPLSQV